MTIETRATQVRLPADDRLDIEDLCARYVWGLSLGDPHAVVACFTEDGYMHHPPQGKCVGHEAIRELLNDLWYSRPGWFPGRQYVAHQLRVEADSESSARVRAFWTILQHSVGFGSNFIFRLGHWDNRVVKTDDGWLFEYLTVNKWLGDGVPWDGDRARAFGTPLTDDPALDPSK